MFASGSCLTSYHVAGQIWWAGEVTVGLLSAIFTGVNGTMEPALNPPLSKTSQVPSTMVPAIIEQLYIHNLINSTKA